MGYDLARVKPIFEKKSRGFKSNIANIYIPTGIKSVSAYQVSSLVGKYSSFCTLTLHQANG